MKVKDLLKQDLPPTDADAEMRRDHTLGSVKHNIKHFGDHGDGVVEALEKLHTVDSQLSHGEAKRVLKAIDEARAKVEACLHKGGCK